MKKDLIIIVDFGGYNNQLIPRLIRNESVYCELYSNDKAIEKIKTLNPIGVILCGNNDLSASEDKESIREFLELNLPVLSLNYPTKLIAKENGLEILKLSRKECRTEFEIKTDDMIFDEIKKISTSSYLDFIKNVAQKFEILAENENQIFAFKKDNFYGLDFPSEYLDTENGKILLDNFLFKICKAKADWTIDKVSENLISELKENIGDKKVLLALSGGVDSSVCAKLLSKAIGKQLTCILVDHGLMRKNEAMEVENAFKDSELNFIHINAEERFLKKLENITDPEKKRKIIGEEFIRVFEEESKKLGEIEFLAQGTIYPDLIESGIGAKVVKSHHNVGGLPKNIGFEGIIEPLKDLFKNEVRALGKELGLDEKLYTRQPFPGPGLAVRCIGEITKEKLNILRDADFIFREELEKAVINKFASQYFAVITNNKTVGTKDGARIYGYTIALRAIKTSDFMSAEWVKIPYEILERISTRITGEVKNVNRVVYDITSKPPATIEWE